MSDFDIQIASRTIYGEARNQGEDGMQAVAWVIANRFNAGKWYTARTVAGTCLKPMQFSCWNRTDPNFVLIVNMSDTDPLLVDCVLYIRNALSSNSSEDPTHGSTFYHTENITPSWAHTMKKTVQIGAHIFYRET